MAMQFEFDDGNLNEERTLNLLRRLKELRAIMRSVETEEQK